MRRRTRQQFLISAAALGALVALSTITTAADPVQKAWASASPVQAYGIAPSGRMPAQAGASSIQLLNEADSGGDVWFLVDGQEHSLKPGATMDLAGNRPHLVEFNTGGNAGDVRFTLYQGLYKFKVTPEGWGLYKSSSSPAPAVAGSAPQATSPVTGRQAFTPPLPAEDLRTRRPVGRAAAAQPGTTARPVNPPQSPAATTGSGQDTTRSIAAPPPPGVTRERTTNP